MTSSTTTTAALVGAIEGAATADELFAATRALALAAEPEPDPEAIACLLQVLRFNNPGAAVAAVEGLIRRGRASVGPLLDSLDPHNYGARAWAVRALSGIGDVRGLEVLEEALASDVGPSVRRAAARGLGSLDMTELVPAERERVRERILAALAAGSRDGEWVVRYAVVVGLESLSLPLPPGDRLRPHAEGLLQERRHPGLEDTPVVRLRADRALERLAGGSASSDPVHR